MERQLQLCILETSKDQEDKKICIVKFSFQNFAVAELFQYCQTMMERSTKLQTVITTGIMKIMTLSLRLTAVRNQS